MVGPLRKDGQPDMRYKSNRESASSNFVPQKSALTNGTLRSSDNDKFERNFPGPLRKDGQLDMRYAVNKNHVAENKVNISEKIPVRITNATNSSVPLRKDGQPDMRFNCNKVEAKLNPPGPLRKDGQPDMRYVANRKYVAEREAQKVAENKYTFCNVPGPLRKDGQLDMRYTVNKNHVAENNVNISEKIPVRITNATNSSVPLRKDGQPDMRFNCNKVEAKLSPPGPLRKDGQPDMRYMANRKYVAERDAQKVAENKKTAKDVKKAGAITGKIQFGHVNARSLGKKGRMELLEDEIAKSKFNVVAVTETHFADDSHLNVPCPKGFKALHRSREDRKGGGVAIFYRDDIDITRHLHESYKSFEYLDVSIAIGSSEKTRIVTIYRPPGNSKRDFLEEFENLLKTSEGGKKRGFIIAGDFNLHVKNPDSNDRAFLALIRSHGLVQHIEEPTHEKGEILDLILSRPSDTLVKNVRVGDFFSDHKFVHCTILIETKKEDIIEREE